MLQDTVTYYKSLGWATIRIEPCGKAPVNSGVSWSDRIDGPTDFHDGENIGVRLGAPSGGLIDIDLDSPQAIALAPFFLRPTATFGRASSPRSHWLYKCVDLEKSERPSKTTVELRSNGHQTVFPGSIHVTGEPIQWYDFPPGGPELITLTEIRASFFKLAAATVIALESPQAKQGRAVHDLALALAGALWREGWPLEAARGLILPALVCGLGDDPTGHREDAISATWGDDERERTGWPTVAQILSDTVSKKLQRFTQASEHGFDQRLAGGISLSSALSGDFGDLIRSKNDEGNARWLATNYGPDLRFVEGLGWYRWERTCWRPDDGAWPELGALSRALLDHADALTGPAARTVRGWGQQCGNAGRIKSTSEFAAHIQPFQIKDAARLDADPWLLGTPSGTIDLRTGQLREASRDDLITKQTGVPYDPHATAPRFGQFLAEIFAGDSELIMYMLRYLGSALVGRPPDRMFQVWWGGGKNGGKNGKSTFVDTLEFVFGDYAHPMSMGMLLHSGRGGARQSGAASPDLAALRGVRLTTSVETDAGQRWNESLVKVLTGGDTVTARKLYREPISFPPTWSIALATNHKPIVRGTDQAIWDRIHLVPFTQRFERGDPLLRDKLRDEGPGILALLVRACLDWQRSGITPPTVVRDAVSEYQSEQDTLGDFMRECLRAAPRAKTGKSDLYRAYRRWAEESGEHVFSAQIVNRQLRERGLTLHGSGGTAHWLGVALAQRV